MKLILIEHNVIAMTVENASDMDVAAKEAIHTSSTQQHKRSKE